MMSASCSAEFVLVSLSPGCTSYVYVFFFKQKTAYELRISDWSSDVCSSDLVSSSRCSSQVYPQAAGPVEACGRPSPNRRRFETGREIGRASCRERVCQYV